MPYGFYMTERNQNYFLDWCLIALAMLIALCSYISDVNGFRLGFKDYVYWFQRSGSLVVFIGVILQFRQLICTEEGDTLNSAFGKHIGYSAGRMNAQQKIFQILATLLSVLGTVIWGYGDLPFKI